MLETKIRRATADDAQSITLLACQVQALHHESLPQIYKPVDPRAALDWHKKLLDDPLILAFVAEADRVVGYAITRRVSSPAHVFKYAADFAEVDSFGVDENARGQGIGTALHAAIASYWKQSGVSELRLTVIEFNSAARRFYERLGYSEQMTRMSLAI
jgi:ribosomal protein S18 acetylase RimI-like enzyme